MMTEIRSVVLGARNTKNLLQRGMKELFRGIKNVVLTGVIVA